MQVSLPPKLEEFIAAKIASGRYSDADEVIREALRFMETHEEWLREIKLEKLRREIQVGLDQLNRGESMDGAEFFKSLEQE
jgi:antitoxin ParD1/3/4